MWPRVPILRTVPSVCVCVCATAESVVALRSSCVSSLGAESLSRALRSYCVSSQWHAVLVRVVPEQSLEVGSVPLHQCECSMHRLCTVVHFVLLDTSVGGVSSTLLGTCSCMDKNNMRVSKLPKGWQRHNTSVEVVYCCDAG